MTEYKIARDRAEELFNIYCEARRESGRQFDEDDPEWKAVNDLFRYGQSGEKLLDDKVFAESLNNRLKGILVRATEALSYGEDVGKHLAQGLAAFLK